MDVEQTQTVQGEKKDKRNKWIGIVTEVVIYACLLFVCAYIIPNYVIQRAQVSGPSMENTLQNGDNLLVDKISSRFGDYSRFDIVVFYPYGKEQKDEHFVKRVIGLPGETIQIKGRDIFVDGKKLKENYGKQAITYQGIASEPLILGEDEYFLMGDNREISYDSRYEEIGPVHKSQIDGRAVVRIWPFQKIGVL